MDDVQDTGVVNQPEGETGASQPASEETPQIQESSEASADVTGAEEKSPSTVPYDRFKEVNDRYRQTEEELRSLRDELGQVRSSIPQKQADPQEEQVKQTLKQYGFVSQDEVNQTVQRIQQDIRTDQELSRLEGKYNGKDGRPKFDRRQVLQFAIQRNIADPEVAYKSLNESALINWHIQQASAKQKGIKTEQSNSTGGPTGGPSSSDLLDQYRQGDEGALKALIKRSGAYRKIMGN